MADIIYPFKKYNYKVTIDGTEAAGFSEVSAPDITVDPIEYREGNMAGKTPGKQPGILKYSNVDDEGKDSASWQLEKAWPTKYTAPDFNATSNEVAIESLELVCEGITRTM